MLRPNYDDGIIFLNTVSTNVHIPPSFTESICTLSLPNSTLSSIFHFLPSTLLACAVLFVMYCRVFSILSYDASHPISPLLSLLLLLSFPSLAAPPLPSHPFSFYFSSILFPFSLPSHVSLITSTPPICLVLFWGGGFFHLNTTQLLLLPLGFSPTLPLTFSVFPCGSPFAIFITFSVLSV